MHPAVSSGLLQAMYYMIPQAGMQLFKEPHLEDVLLYFAYNVS